MINFQPTFLTSVGTVRFIFGAILILPDSSNALSARRTASGSACALSTRALTASDAGKPAAALLSRSSSIFWSVADFGDIAFILQNAPKSPDKTRLSAGEFLMKTNYSRPVDQSIVGMKLRACRRTGALK
jgi:hypothetical protein